MKDCIGNGQSQNKNELEFVFSILENEGFASFYKGITVGLFYVPISAVPVLLPFFLEEG